MDQSPAISRRVYSVSELTDELKSIIEEKFAFLWISGEVSNLRRATSGHIYFSLKDRNAQIAAVIFKNTAQNISQTLSDGSLITGFGRIGLYAPRGSYQIIFEYIESTGVGALLVAFEQLKQRLEKEGLFDPSLKKTIPLLPTLVTVITSPAGAVLRDILNIASRRFANLQLEIIPVAVQGQEAVAQIAAAVDLADQRHWSDVIILARGGGSVEDLQAFNSETVARAIHRCTIPLVSAVGHETDFSIADWVADLRAPTPSAAAELVFPSKDDLTYTCLQLQQRLVRRQRTILERWRSLVSIAEKRLIHPQRRVYEWLLRVDDLHLRLTRRIQERLHQRIQSFQWWNDRLSQAPQTMGIEIYKEKVENLDYNLINNMNKFIDAMRTKVAVCQQGLRALDPQQVLNRGYSITRWQKNAQIIRDSQAVQIGDVIEILLAQGQLEAQVKKRSV